jgi:hypothetical protein
VRSFAQATLSGVAQAHGPAVHALLQYLADAGFQVPPVPVGIDGQGREVLSYLDGEAGHYPLASKCRCDPL